MSGRLQPADSPGCLVTLAPGQKLGLGGLVKGWGVDQVVARFRARGLTDFCVQAGGDLSPKGWRSSWRCGHLQASTAGLAPEGLEDEMNETNPSVDWFFRKATAWQAEYAKLRSILLSCPVTEELKWGVPAYQHDGKNIVLMHGFKDYCAVLFPKGALLKDPAGVLIQQTKNVQSARQLRFTSVAQITKLAPTLKRYVKEAIALEQAGAKVQFKAPEEFDVPAEFQERLDDNPPLSAAFEALTPGRQRGYLLYFSQAKQSKTRAARVEKAIPQIFAGKGRDD